MLLWVAGAAIGILTAFILIFKYTKTGKNDMIGYSTKCNKCGTVTNGDKCPRCTTDTKDWR
ncbi:hypothetical protein OAK30_06775 [Candidatus Nitrosopelagicus sp.]|nr:hypothetical protein [Candidatus Nitrosopelagicus sp.]